MLVVAKQVDNGYLSPTYKTFHRIIEWIDFSCIWGCAWVGMQELSALEWKLVAWSQQHIVARIAWVMLNFVKSKKKGFLINQE